MDEELTPRLALPLLYAAQAQKEETHNEALMRIDMAVQPCVDGAGADTPPPAPATGSCWIVGASPVGAWAGHALAIACRTASGWRFVEAREGMSVWRSDTKRVATFSTGVWQDGVVAATRLIVDGDAVVGARQPAIANPSGGAIADTEARAAIDALLAAVRAHGLIGA